MTKTLNAQINYLINLNNAISKVIEFTRKTKTKTYEAKQLREKLYQLQMSLDEKMVALARINAQEHEKRLAII